MRAYRRNEEAEECTDYKMMDNELDRVREVRESISSLMKRNWCGLVLLDETLGLPEVKLS